MHHQSIRKRVSKKSMKKSAKKSMKRSRKKSMKKSQKRMIPLSIRSRITNVAKKVKQAVSDELKDLDRII